MNVVEYKRLESEGDTVDKGAMVVEYEVLLRSLGDNFERGAKVVEYTLLESEDKENQKGE